MPVHMIGDVSREQTEVELGPLTISSSMGESVCPAIYSARLKIRRHFISIPAFSSVRVSFCAARWKVEKRTDLILM